MEFFSRHNDFVTFLQRCNVLYFKNNWFAAPLMVCINIFLYTYISMGECNTILSAYTVYRHLG